MQVIKPVFDTYHETISNDLNELDGHSNIIKKSNKINLDL